MKKHAVAIEIVITCCIILLAMGYLTHRFQYRELGSGGGFENFYALEKNSLDYMSFGSSHAGCTVNNIKIWNDLGYAGFTLTAGSQRIEETYYFVQEALKYQHPKVIFVETDLVGMYERNESGKLEHDLASLYRCDLGMRWSLSYAGMVLNQARIYDLSFEQTMNLLLKLPITHARYAELVRSDYVNDTPFNTGYYGDDTVGDATAPTLTERRAPIDEESLAYMGRIKNLCDQKGVQVLFMHAPYPETEEEGAKQNTIADYLASIGADYVDFVRDDSIGLIYQEDMRDDNNHLNNKGADKVTGWLETYLQAYNLTDHRDDERYDLWDRCSRWFDLRQVQGILATADDLYTYLNLIRQYCGQYDVLMTFSGNYNVNNVIDPAIFPEIGIDEEGYEQGGAWLIHGNKVEWSSGVQDTYKRTMIINNVPITFSRLLPASDEAAQRDADGGYTGRNVNDGMYIGQTNYASVVNGINIAIYDPELSFLVDSSAINIYDSMALVRKE